MQINLPYSVIRSAEQFMLTVYMNKCLIANKVEHLTFLQENTLLEK